MKEENKGPSEGVGSHANKTEADDFKNYPYHGICGKCGNYHAKLNKDCLCDNCRGGGVKRIGALTELVLKFVEPRFKNRPHEEPSPVSIGDSRKGEAMKQHAIEFYLWVEGLLNDIDRCEEIECLDLFQKYDKFLSRK